MAQKPVSPRWRALALVLIGLVAGTLLLGTASAHIGTPAHLWNTHIKPKVRNLTYTKTQANKRFVQSNGGVKMFAAVEATGFAPNIRESAGPVDSISKQGTGEYRITFTRNFGPSGVNPVTFAQCTAVNTAGATCSWSYNGTSVNSIDVSARTADGVATDVVFSLVVWVPA